MLQNHNENAPACPKCGGLTIGKGKGKRGCKSCGYRFIWPAVTCVVCGEPKSIGQGRRKPYCDKHYPTMGEIKADNNKRYRSNHPAPKRGPRAKSTPVYIPPPPRKQGEFIRVDGNTIEITADRNLIWNGGSILPASPVEVLLWKYIHAEKE